MLLATLVLGVASMGVASTAAAPSASAYGPGLTLTVSCRVIGNREVCTLSGTGWDSDVVITLQVHSTPTTIGTVTSTSSGTFGPYTISLPCSVTAGQHTFIATDAEGQSASQEATIVALPGCYPVLTGSGTIPATAASATPVAATTGSSSSLAFTGADITITIAVAAGLIAIGGMVVTSTRRRRRHDWPSARG